MKKISLIIPAKTKNFFVEDILINVMLWSLKPNEILIINTSINKIKISNKINKQIKQNKIKLKIINKKNFFPGAARNVGINLTRNYYIVFMDMNTLPYDKDWLKINFNYLVKKKLDGICGQTFYLAENYSQKIIRASSYGKVFLRTIPGSIFLKKTVDKVGFFNFKTRAGEDTEWLKKLDSYKLRVENAPIPLYYKGLYNFSFLSIIKKWFRNYLYSSSLPHLSNQKFFYTFLCFFTLLIIILNWNYSNDLTAEGEVFFIPHITKIYLITSALLYVLIRGILFPITKKINIKFLFPINFIVITFFSFILDFVKTITFVLSFFSRFLKLQKDKKH